MSEPEREWARAVPANPVETSIQASGMSCEEIGALRKAFEEEGKPMPGAEG